MSSNYFIEENPTVVECIREPRGEGGMEGFQRDEIYKAQMISSPIKYWRVWPCFDDKDYYEVCGSVFFNRFFQIKKYNEDSTQEAVSHQ